MSTEPTAATMNDPFVTGGKACRIHAFGGPEVIRVGSWGADPKRFS